MKCIGSDCTSPRPSLKTKTLFQMVMQPIKMWDSFNDWMSKNQRCYVGTHLFPFDGESIVNASAASVVEKGGGSDKSELAITVDDARNVNRTPQYRRKGPDLEQFRSDKQYKARIE